MGGTALTTTKQLQGWSHFGSTFFVSEEYENGFVRTKHRFTIIAIVSRHMMMILRDARALFPAEPYRLQIEELSLCNHRTQNSVTR